MGSLNELGAKETCSLVLDDFSKLTMSYTLEGFSELKKDIKDKGQLVPILLRDGKILDGRHRHKVCMDLGIGILYKELGCLSDDEALDVVISNSLNKATSTDAAKVEAYLMCQAKGIKNVDMSKTFSRLNINYVRKIRFIEKENPEYLNVLLHQNKVRLYNAEFGKVEDYGTVNGLWRTLKGNQKLAKQVVEVEPEPVSSRNHSVDLEEYFNNEAAENEYWELFNIAKANGTNLHPGSELGKKVASLIKNKYSSM